MTSLELDDVKFICESSYKWDNLKGKTVFISGGTGFIGSLIVEILKYRNRHYGNNIKIIVCSRHKNTVEDCVKYVKHDISLPINFNEKLDFIIHLASNTHPAQYSNDPVGTITTNVFGAYNLLKLANEHGSRFLLASSVEIYGNGDGRLIDENYCGYINCNTSRAGYNESKRLAESLCQSFREQYGVDCVIARLARVFGADTKADSKAMAQFITNAINKQDIIIKSDGKQRYSYLYVVDAVTGILKILLDGVSGEAYNIAPQDDGKTLGQYAQHIADYTNTKVIFNTVGQVGSSTATYAVLDSSKLRGLGWNEKYDAYNGIKRTIEIIRERQKSLDKNK